MKRKLVWRMSVDEALNLELHNTCLLWELTDIAESSLGLTKVECAAHIAIKGKYFVVTFSPLRKGLAHDRSTI